jgi:hypothetical protein
MSRAFRLPFTYARRRNKTVHAVKSELCGNFGWWALAGSNRGPSACKLGGNPLYDPPAPMVFNNLGRLLSHSRHPLRAQNRPVLIRF